MYRGEKGLSHIECAFVCIRVHACTQVVCSGEVFSLHTLDIIVCVRFFFQWPVRAASYLLHRHSLLTLGAYGEKPLHQ